ncbi:hotdog domain-containing protein [Pseudorhodoplanes sp.]|jgi:acyl-coenzyme A thioesterase PaaI-like protein|uniref:hotdog domain-containing protein n=1 Tax=Pseudorhodoplanes sp. TaxID=1934341 RepID=UPI002CFF99F9|nr:hotdog domain-containing protein [Pseudorhodoplanes sp.]HWV40353.1 hotdog domain-containing protein [Pseudorhodoplanes sp.]
MAANAVASTPSMFGLRAASRLMLEVVPPWTQEMGLLLESVEAWRPAGAGLDWNPGAVLRLPFTRKLCADGKTVSPQAVMALADAAMIFACAAAWNGYRPMNAVDQTAHFLGSAQFDLLADARIIRAGTMTCFGRVSIFGASHRQPVAMVCSAYTVV